MPVNETGIDQSSSAERRDSEPSRLTTVGAAAALALSVSVANATDRIGQDVFLEASGYTATAGALSLQTEPESNVMAVSYEETDDDGANPKILKGQLSRDMFISLLERGSDGLWRLSESNGTQLVKAANLTPAPRPIGGFDTYDAPDYEPEAPLLVEFSNWDFKQYSCEGLKFVQKMKCRSKNGKTSAELYSEKAEAIAEGQRLDAEHAETLARVESKQNDNAEKDKKIASQRAAMALLRKWQAEAQQDQTER